MDILHQILETKLQELEEKKSLQNLSELILKVETQSGNAQSNNAHSKSAQAEINEAESSGQNLKVRNTLTSFEGAFDRNSFPQIIAEVKKASPSRGVLREDFNHLELAQKYFELGARAVSVLTDEKYFQGSSKYLEEIHAKFPSLPLLRKDFIIDEYQIWEAKLWGASAVLLIVAAFENSKVNLVPIETASIPENKRLAHRELLFKLLTKTYELGLDCLLEVHDKAELEVALSLLERLSEAFPKKNFFLGINNRSLHDFSVSLETSMELQKHFEKLTHQNNSTQDHTVGKQELAKKVFLVAESGIGSKEDMLQLRENQINIFLIGESLVKGSFR